MIGNSKLKKEIDGIKSWLVDLRRYFHMNPELSEREYATRDKIREELNELGIENKVLAGTGVVGLIEGGKPGNTVALRADMDALPIDDKKDSIYSSQVKGVMHACGHDAHMSILLGAAKVLNNLKNDLSGNVKLIFQPAEETVGGAKPMIAEGVLKDPEVDYIFGLHVDNSIDCGKIGIKYDQMKAASDMITIRVYGLSAHGAYPQNGIDALLISSYIILGIQTISSRNLDPRKSGVISLGSIKGGYARNIICDYIEIEGIVRTLDEESRDRTLSRLKEIVEGVASSMGGRGELVVEEGYTYLINNREVLEVVEANSRELLGTDSVEIIKYPSYGVEDFAFFAEAKPAAFFSLGTRNEKKNIVKEGHTDLFDIDEEALALGVLLQVKNALSVLA